MEQNKVGNSDRGGLGIWLLALLMVGISSYSAIEQPAILVPMTHDDPPVIVHGGSLHFRLHAWDESTAFDQWTVPTNGAANLIQGGTSYSPPVPTGLASGWEIKVCNDQPCAHGIRIVTDAAQGQYQIRRTDSGDLVDPPTVVNAGTPHAQNDHMFHSPSYFPNYLFIDGKEYDCAAPHTDCSIHLGQQY